MRKMWFDNQDEMGKASIIAMYRQLESLEEQLKFVLVLLYSLKGEQQERFREDINMYESYFEDTDFMRKVRHRDSLVRDYPSEYFGKNFGKDDPFTFDPELEKQINDIGMDIMATLGFVIKLRENNMYIPDEA